MTEYLIIHQFWRKSGETLTSEYLMSFADEQQLKDFIMDKRIELDKVFDQEVFYSSGKLDVRVSDISAHTIGYQEVHSLKENDNETIL